METEVTEPRFLSFVLLERSDREREEQLASRRVGPR